MTISALLPSLQATSFLAETPLQSTFKQDINLQIPSQGARLIFNADFMSQIDNVSVPGQSFIPKQATWYSPDSVSEVEKSFLTDVFTSGLTYEQYILFRNHMINTYNTAPDSYLSVTTCRRMLSCDIAVLHKIHSFLEHWGLINSRNSPSTFQHMSEQPPVRVTNSTSEKSNLQTIPASKNAIDKSYDGKEYGFESPNRPSWAETEVDSLLAAVEKHGNDWYLIGKELGKPTSECLLLYLSLSVDIGKDFLSSLSSDCFPFQLHDNPLIFLLEFFGANFTRTFSADFSHNLASSSQTLDASTNMSEFLKSNFSVILQSESNRFLSLSEKLVSAQLKKLSMKIKYLEELDSSILQERKSLERERLHLFLERYNLKKSLLGVGDVKSSA